MRRPHSNYTSSVSAFRVRHGTAGRPAGSRILLCAANNTWTKIRRCMLAACCKINCHPAPRTNSNTSKHPATIANVTIYATQSQGTGSCRPACLRAPASLLLRPRAPKHCGLGWFAPLPEAASNSPRTQAFGRTTAPDCFAKEEAPTAVSTTKPPPDAHSSSSSVVAPKRRTNNAQAGTQAAQEYQSARLLQPNR